MLLLYSREGTISIVNFLTAVFFWFKGQSWIKYKKPDLKKYCPANILCQLQSSDSNFREKETRIGNLTMTTDTFQIAPPSYVSSWSWGSFTKYLQCATPNFFID